MTSSVPIGPVTLVFADLEASSTGWQRHGQTYGDALRAMHALARDCAERHGGTYVKNTGDGFLLAFAAPMAAVLCSRDIQSALLTDGWDATLPRLALRIGIHTDTPELLDGDYTGFAMWRAERVMEAAHGAQILLSETTHALIKHEIAASPECACETLGAFRLRDLLAPVPLFRLSISGLSLSTLPPRALPQDRHNLPEEERPFIGRRGELADVTRLFREQGAHLVTITGIGGIGKTRLARQVAAALTDDFPDGVWMVELDSLDTREEALATIAGVLQIEGDRDDTERTLRTALASKRLFLLLDCFERIAQHAGLIEQILRAAPQVRCLVTSRVVLGLPREFEYPLQPLPTSGSGGEGPPSESMQLFVEAAMHVIHDFALTPDNRSLVEQLCAEMEGIPLSLILAAGRLRHLSLRDLLEQVREHRFDVLRRRPVGPDRQAALQQVIADSFLMLPGEQQRLLCRLSIFVGGFYLEDADYVCGTASRADLLDGIALLRENSLVQAQTLGDHTRFKLLDTVREYLAGLKRGDDLEAELLDCRKRHAARYADLARRIDTLMQQGRWNEGITMLWREIGNLRAAAAFCIEIQDCPLVADFADALGRIYFEAGLWDDFERLARSAEEAAERLNRPFLRARMLGLRGALAARRGDRAETRRLWEERLKLSLQIGDVAGAADTLSDLADQAREAGDHAEARRLLRRAIRMAQSENRLSLLAVARIIQADIALDEGKADIARKYADRARRMTVGSIDVDTVLYVHARLGHIYREIGDFAQAEDSLQTAIRLAAEGNRDFSLISALLDLGALYERQGNLRCAAYAYTTAARIHPDIASRRSEAAASALAHFYREIEDPTIKAFLDQSRDRSWSEILTDLLIECRRACADGRHSVPSSKGEENGRTNVGDVHRPDARY
jgi:predicted ATPase/class 3 adenylate cyclase